MKRILITGANSYIGTSFERYLARWPEEYTVDTIDMHGDVWRQTSFVGYDSVFHVAGIAHADIGHLSEADQSLYYQVNTELPVRTAQQAKIDGVRQFIFMSSAIVYGDSAPFGKEKIITKDTLPAPSNFYGDSKLKAEEGLLPLQEERFNVVILRPPMIYGKGSKGNYPILAKYAKMFPVFPDIKNERSILYIENLCELVRLIINRSEKGVFCPQNEKAVSTRDLVKAISNSHGKQIFMLCGLGHIVYLFRSSKLVNKVFGNFTYDMKLSSFSSMNYRVIDFETSILRTEK